MRLLVYYLAKHVCDVKLFLFRQQADYTRLLGPDRRQLLIPWHTVQQTILLPLHVVTLIFEVLWVYCLSPMLHQRH